MLTARAWTALTVLGLGALTWFLAVHAGQRALQDDVCDFRAYYSAATEMRAGRDPYQLTPKPYLYPPLFAALCIPLTSLSRSQAALAYLPLLLGAALLSLYLAPKLMLARLDVAPTPARLGAAILLTAGLMFDRIKADTQMFQVNTLMLLLQILGLYWLDQKPWLAGSALGLGLNIKGQSITMLPYLLLRKRWGAAAAMVASAVGFSLLPGAAIGWKTNLDYLGHLFGGLLALTGTRPPAHASTHLEDATASFSVSVTSGIARILRDSGESQWLWVVVGVLLAVLLLGAILAYRRQGVPVLRWPDRHAQTHQPWRGLIAVEWACLTLATLVFNPQTNTRHLVLALLPVALAMAAATSADSRRVRGLMIAGAAVLFAALTLPPGNRKVPWMVELVTHWQYFGGPAWLLLVSIGLFLLAGLHRFQAWAGTPEAKSEQATLGHSPVFGRKPLSRS